jgi:hypothetical protein
MRNERRWWNPREGCTWEGGSLPVCMSVRLRTHSYALAAGGGRDAHADNTDAESGVVDR